MSDGAFALIVLGTPAVVLTAIMVKTWDAPPEAVGVSTWTGAGVLALALLAVLARAVSR